MCTSRPAAGQVVGAMSRSATAWLATSLCGFVQLHPPIDHFCFNDAARKVPKQDASQHEVNWFTFPLESVAMTRANRLAWSIESHLTTCTIFSLPRDLYIRRERVHTLGDCLQEYSSRRASSHCGFLFRCALEAPAFLLTELDGFGTLAHWSAHAECPVKRAAAEEDDVKSGTSYRQRSAAVRRVCTDCTRRASASAPITGFRRSFTVMRRSTRTAAVNPLQRHCTFQSHGGWRNCVIGSWVSSSFGGGPPWTRGVVSPLRRWTISWLRHEILFSGPCRQEVLWLRAVDFSYCSTWHSFAIRSFQRTIVVSPIARGLECADYWFSWRCSCVSVGCGRRMLPAEDISGPLRSMTVSIVVLAILACRGFGAGESSMFVLWLCVCVCVFFSKRTNKYRTIAICMKLAEHSSILCVGRYDGAAPHRRDVTVRNPIVALDSPIAITLAKHV